MNNQSAINNVEEKGKTLQSPTVSTKLDSLKEQYKHLCKVAQVRLHLVVQHVSECIHWYLK